MATPILDLSMFNPSIEIIVRAGTTQAPNALDTLKQNYKAQDIIYPDAIGISVVLHPGYNVDALTFHNHFKHKKVSHATISAVRRAIQGVGYEMVLFITPHSPTWPDHHSLAVSINHSIEFELPDAVGQALIATLIVDDNPHITP